MEVEPTGAAGSEAKYVSKAVAGVGLEQLVAWS